MIQLVALRPCVHCSSHAVATGLDKRGRRVVVCSSCGGRDAAPESMQPRKASKTTPVEKPYWIDN